MPVYSVFYKIWCKWDRNR